MSYQRPFRWKVLYTNSTNVSRTVFNINVFLKIPFNDIGTAIPSLLLTSKNELVYSSALIISQKAVQAWNNFFNAKQSCNVFISAMPCH